MSTLLTGTGYKSFADMLAEPRPVEPLDSSYQDRLFDSVVDESIKDDAFRRRVMNHLRSLAETNQPGRQKTELAELLKVKITVEIIRSTWGDTRRYGDKATTTNDAIFKEVGRILGVSKSVAKKRYYAATKILPPDGVQVHVSDE